MRILFFLAIRFQIALEIQTLQTKIGGRLRHTT
jgi:hypothetical protein